MKILFLGAPGSGKSTQGQIFAEENGFRWISSGELCRKSGDDGILKTIRGAKLIDDNLISEMVIREIRDGGENVVLDGFPRNRRQCEILTENNIKIDAILEISVDKEEILKRVRARGREQDSEEVVLERIKMYEDSRDEIVGYYKRRGIEFKKVSGVGEIGDIAKEVRKAVL